MRSVFQLWDTEMDDSTLHMPPKRCPSCDTELAWDAILCVSCGYHFALGRQLVTTTHSAGGSTSHSNPQAPPAASTAVDTPLINFLSIFWIHGRIPRGRWWTIQIGYEAIIVLGSKLMENGLISNTVVLTTTWIASWIVFMAHVKRWHDIDRSGLWCLVFLIPILGPVYALIELGFQRGTEGANEYGDQSG